MRDLRHRLIIRRSKIRTAQLELYGGVAMKPEGTKEFKVPIELLKAFQNDVRTIPQHLPVNGWITFDLEMLTSVLRRGDPKAGVALAEKLEALKVAGGELVIMAAATEASR